MLGDNIEVHEQVNRHDAKKNKVYENSHETKGAVKMFFMIFRKNRQPVEYIFESASTFQLNVFFANGLLSPYQTPGQRQVPVYRALFACLFLLICRCNLFMIMFEYGLDAPFQE